MLRKKIGAAILAVVLSAGGWSVPSANAAEPQLQITGQQTAPNAAVGESVYNDTLAPVMRITALAGEELLINPGESYEFRNDTSSSKSLSNDGSSSKGILLDYVTYREDGTIYSDNMDSIGTPLILGGGWAVVTAVGPNPLTVTLKDGISYSASSVPALERYTLNKGDSYRIVNESDKSRAIMSDASSKDEKRYDYATYNDEGEPSGSDFNSVSKPTISVGEEFIVTGASSTPVTVAFPYGYFTAEVSAEPAYNRVTLRIGESYRFTNTSDKTDTLESDGTTKDKFDYVVYLADGTESSRGSNTSTEPSIVGGRYAVITMVAGNPVTFGAPYRTFDVGSATGDAISHIDISPGDSYRFDNNGSLTNPIKNNASVVDGKFDYVIYKADGSVYTDGFNKDTDPTIPAGGYAIVTVVAIVNDVPITFDYTDDFAVEESSEPAYIRVVLGRGESYEFVNISGESERLDSDAKTSNPARTFDYVTYYEDGTERSRGENRTMEPLVYPNNKVSVTGASDTPVTTGAIYTSFKGLGRPNESISKITVQPGESYIFNNNGSLNNPINNNAKEAGSLFDYVMYKADGSLGTDGMNKSTNPMVPAGGEAVVTVTGSQPVVFDYTDDFTVQPSTEPAYLRVILQQGESFAYTNISVESESLDSDATPSSGRRFSYVTYDVDGNVRTQNPDTLTEPLVRAGERTVVTAVSANPVTFGGIYRVFKGDGSPGDGIQKLTIQPGESYRFTNTGSDTAGPDHNGAELDAEIDYATYEADGSRFFDGFGTTSSPNIPAGGESIVTNISDSPITFTYAVNLKPEPSTEPAFHRITLNPGESYQFMNISGAAKALERGEMASGARWSYVNYRADGSEYSSGTDTTQLPLVQAGGKAVMTNSSDVPIAIGAVYRLFQVGPVESGETTQVTVNQGESYKFTLTGTAAAAVTMNGAAGERYFDFATYGTNTGGVEQADLAQMDAAQTSISLDVGQVLIVTVTSSSAVTFSFNQQVTAEPSTEPALLKASLSQGGQVIYTSKSEHPAPLVNNASATGGLYQYVLKDAAGQVIREENGVNIEQTIPGKASIQLTVAGTGITFGAPYRVFTLQEVIGGDWEELIEQVEKVADFPAGEKGLYRFTAQAAGKYRFTVKEGANYDQVPVLSLYSNADMTELLVTSSAVEQIYGWDYTVVEQELMAGQTIYVKLEEVNGKALQTVIKAALMPTGTDTSYAYGKGNQLLKTILYTGDEIWFEYDRNGNVSKRTKKVFPFVD